MMFSIRMIRTDRQLVNTTTGHKKWAEIFPTNEMHFPDQGPFFSGCTKLCIRANRNLSFSGHIRWYVLDNPHNSFSIYSGCGKPFSEMKTSDVVITVLVFFHNLEATKAKIKTSFFFFVVSSR